MSKYYGNILEDDTIELTFNTFNSSGASVTVTTFASTDVHVHKDGGLTQTNAGVTIDIDFDAIVGNHMIFIDTSADAFYATGSNYEVRVEGITVDSQTINAFIGSFSIENRFMQGTDSAALASVCTEGRLAELDAANLPADIDAILADVTGINGDAMRGTNGANTVVPDAAGVAPTAIENRQEMDSNSTQLAAIVEDTGTTIPAQLDSMSGATFNTTTDSLEAIRNRGDAAWTTGAGGDATEAKQDTILAKLLSYVRILSRKDSAIATDDAAQVTEINADEGAGAGAYTNTTDSQEAIKDAITGGGGTPHIE